MRRWGLRLFTLLIIIGFLSAWYLISKPHISKFPVAAAICNAVRPEWFKELTLNGIISSNQTTTSEKKRKKVNEFLTLGRHGHWVERETCPKMVRSKKPPSILDRSWSSGRPPNFPSLLSTFPFLLQTFPRFFRPFPLLFRPFFFNLSTFSTFGFSLLYELWNVNFF